MNSYETRKLERIQKRVKGIKGFYTHLVVYILINTILTLVHLWLDDKGFFGDNVYGVNYWATPLAWGISLLIHGINVFRLSNWEDKKIKELMEEDNLTGENSKDIGGWWK